MSNENRTALAAVVALVGLVATIVWLNTSVWHSDVAYARAHPQPGWVVHEGVITNIGKTNLTTTPPRTGSTVRFADYYGKQLSIPALMLQYPIADGMRTEVDVNKDGQVWVPQSWTDSYDWNPNQSWKGPRAASPTDEVWLSFAAVPVWIVGWVLLTVFMTRGVAWARRMSGRIGS